MSLRLYNILALGYFVIPTNASYTNCCKTAIAYNSKPKHFWVFLQFRIQETTKSACLVLSSLWAFKHSTSTIFSGGVCLCSGSILLGDGERSSSISHHRRGPEEPVPPDAQNSYQASYVYNILLASIISSHTLKNCSRSHSCIATNAA